MRTLAMNRLLRQHADLARCPGRRGGIWPASASMAASTTRHHGGAGWSSSQGRGLVPAWGLTRRDLKMKAAAYTMNRKRRFKSGDCQWSATDTVPSLTANRRRDGRLVVVHSVNTPLFTHNVNPVQSVDNISRILIKIIKKLAAGRLPAVRASLPLITKPEVKGYGANANRPCRCSLSEHRACIMDGQKGG